MAELIDTKLVAKLMGKTAKECGMTRIYSSTDSVHNRKLYDRDTIYPHIEYRRLVKGYDFLADNFLELLAEKVKAEGFDLADCEINARKRKSKVRNWKDPEYKKAYKEYWELPIEERFRRKGREWKIPNPVAPIIPNTENAVYVRLVARFKHNHYIMRAINPDSKKVTTIGWGQMGKLIKLLKYHMEEECYTEVIEKCDIICEWIETGEKFYYDQPIEMGYQLIPIGEKGE